MPFLFSKIKIYNVNHKIKILFLKLIFFKIENIFILKYIFNLVNTFKFLNIYFARKYNVNLKNIVN